METEPAQPSPAPVKEPNNRVRDLGRSRGRLVSWVAVIVLGSMVLSVGGRRLWRKHFAPRMPPVVEMNWLDSEVADAVKARRKAVLDHPRSADAWGDLGAVFRAHGMAPSNACFNEAKRLDPKDYRWPYLIGLDLIDSKAEIGLPMLRRAVAICGDEPAPRLRLAEALLDRGELSEAEKLFRTGLDKGPLNAARAQLGLGRIALEKNDYEHAVEYLRAAIAGAPNSKAAHVALSQAYHRQGNVAAAEEEQRSGVRLKDEIAAWPDPALEFVDHVWVGMRARMHRINLFDLGGFREEAIVLARQTVARYPDSAVARLVLGEMLNKSRSFVPAETALREAIRLDPERAKAYFELGFALQSQRKVPEAAAAYRQAIEKRPDFAPAHYNLALALQALKDEPAALEELKAAIRFRPEYTDAHLALAAMFEQRGAHKDAIAHAEEAFRLAPSDPRPKRMLAELHAKEAKLENETPRP